MKKVIDSFTGEFRWLSNFWMKPVTYGSLEYASNEHAYQAAKTLDPEWREYIRNLAKPGDAKRAGRKVPLRPDWEQIKVEVMRDLVRQKFTKHADMRELLLNTGDAELIEGNTWNDTFWGVCRGKGQNWLGRILMEIREELKEGCYGKT